VTATTLPGLFDELSFGGTWRRCQKAAIAAFARDRANDRAAAAEDGGYEPLVRDVWV
jgi:hypothetical protein